MLGRPEPFQHPKLLNSLGNPEITPGNLGAELKPPVENTAGSDSISPLLNTDIMNQYNPPSIPENVVGNILNPHSASAGVIPGNPGPGIHNNIGGIAGVDGIGPNGLPVSPNINVLDATIPPITPLVPTLLPFNHAVMEGVSRVRCQCPHPETTITDCHCDGDHNKGSHQVSGGQLPPANEFPRPPIPTPPPLKTPAPAPPLSAHRSQTSKTADPCISTGKFDHVLNIIYSKSTVCV